MVKRAVFLGDLHTGGRTSVAPPEIGGRDIPLSRDQKRLYAFWERMCDDVAHADLVVCNGDLVEGLDRHAGGKGCWTTDMLEQTGCAAKLLIMLRGRKYVGTMGSGYHAGQNPIWDQIVTEKVGGSFAPQHAVKIGDHRIHAMHKIGYSREMTNRASPVYKEIIAAMLKERQLGQFDILVRSHAHYFVQVEYGGTIGLVTPCWKFNDDFLDGRHLNDCPDIGYVTAEFNGSNMSVSHTTMKYDGRETLKEIEI